MATTHIRLFFMVIFFAFQACLFSQLQTHKWYFGKNAGLDFATSPPTVLTGALNSYEGCASISDASGNLLFYTNGDTVYNSLHQVMVNGFNLGGSYSTTQSAIILKKPGSASLYYIFTADNCGFVDGLSYSIVDMTLQSGLGAVTIKNTQLYTPTTEKLCAVRHCNGTDFWVVTHGLSNNMFRVFQVSAAGVNSVSVNSSLGLVNNPYCPMGAMKVSPNGRKLALGTNDNVVELFDFDNATGIVSNAQQLVTSATTDPAYGCEFSPDGTKLYGTVYMGNLTNGIVRQWDLCAGSTAAIAASVYTIAINSGGSPLSMQLAPDGKIYIARYYSYSLSAIYNPNLAGAACNFVDQALSVFPNRSYHGLPNFVAGTVQPPLSYAFAQNSNCQALSFQAPAIASPTAISCTAPPGFSVSGFYWLFGDPGSGSANTSTLSNPTHQYNAPGTYTVKLAINYSSCVPDTFVSTVLVPQSLQMSVNPVPGCTGSASVSAGGGYSYLWSPGGYTTAAVSGLAAGIYSVTASNAATGCLLTNTVQVSTLAPSLAVTGSSLICAGQTTTLSASGANTYSWSTGASISSISVAPMVNSTYSVTGTNTLGCSITTPVSVSVSVCSGIHEGGGAMPALKLFPNPFSGAVYVDAGAAVSLTLFDQLGRLLLETELAAGQHPLDLSAYADGMYVLKARSGSSVSVYRLLKQAATD